MQSPLEDEWSSTRGLMLVARGQGQEPAANAGSHVRGSPLRASGPGLGTDGKVDLLLAGTATRYITQSTQADFARNALLWNCFRLFNCSRQTLFHSKGSLNGVIRKEVTL